MNRFLSATAVAFLAATALTPAQAVVIGTADSTNSYPFGAFPSSFFQQIYNKSNFAAPITIGKLTFYNSLSPTTTKPLADTFTFFLSISNEAIPTFDTSNVTFPDSTFTQVFQGKLQTTVNGRLDIVLDTPFTYNPTQGHLLLTTRDFDFGSGGNLFLDTDINTNVMNMRISAFGSDFNRGLVTGFNEAGPVPEPATWAMMIGGFGMMGGAMRYRRRKTTVSFA